jgi:hypothetical protein
MLGQAFYQQAPMLFVKYTRYFNAKFSTNKGKNYFKIGNKFLFHCQKFGALLDDISRVKYVGFNNRKLVTLLSTA